MTWKEKARRTALQRGADLVSEVYPRLDPAWLYGAWGWSNRGQSHWNSTRCPHGCSSASGQTPLTLQPFTLKWFCHKCQRGGGPLGWLQLTQGLDPIAAKRKLRQAAFPDLGTPAARQAKVVREERVLESKKRKRSRALRTQEAKVLWAAGLPIRSNDPAGIYLRRRGLSPTVEPHVARVVPLQRLRVIYPDSPAWRLATGTAAYLVFALRKPRKRGQLKAVQFEALTKKGRYLKSERLRRTLGAASKAAMIVRPQGTRILVVEGPLDALAVAEWFPDVCAVSMAGGAWAARRLPKLQGRPVTLFPDGDAAGHQAARRLLRDMEAAGMESPDTIGLRDKSGRDPLDRYLEWRAAR